MESRGKWPSSGHYQVARAFWGGQRRIAAVGLCLSLRPDRCNPDKRVLEIRGGTPEDRRLVVDQLAATAGENRRTFEMVNPVSDRRRVRKAMNLRQWRSTLRLLRYSGQGSGILGPITRGGNRLRLPVSGVRRFCRGSVRGALPRCAPQERCGYSTSVCMSGGVLPPPVCIFPSYSSARQIATP